MSGPHDTIEVVAHDPEWPRRFEAEARRIKKGLGELALEVHHIGSTAVPGMAAKPVIDIMVAVGSMDPLEEYVTALAQLGYNHVLIDEGQERYFFYSGMPHAHHLHLVRRGSWTYWRHILFRDFLIDHPSAQEEYEALEYVLAARFRENRRSYVDGKTAFIEMVVARAVRERCLLLTLP